MLEHRTDGAVDPAAPATVPTQRGPAREVAIRELRNAGKVLAELEQAGAIGKVTSGGRLVGWLLPATPDEQRIEQMVAAGHMMRATRPGGLVGRRPRPPRSDVPPLSATLVEMRTEERS